MANTYELISSYTVGAGGVTDITFSSISSSYKDLLIKVSGRSDRSGSYDDYIVTAFNGVTTNQSARFIYAVNAATIGSGTDTLIYGPMNGGTATASTFGSTEFYIPNFAGSNYKSVSIDATGETNATDVIRYLNAGLWSSTSAITSVKLYPYYGPKFVQYSTAYLYGVKSS